MNIEPLADLVTWLFICQVYISNTLALLCIWKQKNKTNFWLIWLPLNNYLKVLVQTILKRCNFISSFISSRSEIHLHLRRRHHHLQAKINLTFLSPEKRQIWFLKITEFLIKIWHLRKASDLTFELLFFCCNLIMCQFMRTALFNYLRLQYCRL